MTISYLIPNEQMHLVVNHFCNSNAINRSWLSTWISWLPNNLWSMKIIRLSTQILAIFSSVLILNVKISVKLSSALTWKKLLWIWSRVASLLISPSTCVLLTHIIRAFHHYKLVWRREEHEKFERWNILHNTL